jgi:RNA polymerase sigma-70 factor (ECF subfamily)
MLAMRARTSQSVSDAVEQAEDEAKNPSATTSTGAAVDWAAIVAQIKAGEDAGLEFLYRQFSRGIRYYLCRHLGPEELDDRVHDTFLVVVQAIKKGDLREPERLMGFVRTIVRRQVAGYIDHAVQTRRDQADIESGVTVADSNGDPEQQAIAQQKKQLMKSVLESLSKRDRDILVRFYLNEEPQEQICREMSLTETQFRLLKSRAKARFGEIGKKKLSTAGIFSVFLRTQEH